MAKYVYRCENCGLELEESHPMGQAPDTSVHRCENGIYNTMRRIILPAAVSFIGSGFYKTDNPKTKHVKTNLKVEGNS